MDILLGMILTLSFISLSYGGHSTKSMFLIAFLISSLGVLVTYWTAFIYRGLIGIEYSDRNDKVLVIRI